MAISRSLPRETSNFTVTLYRSYEATGKYEVASTKDCVSYHTVLGHYLLRFA